MGCCIVANTVFVFPPTEEFKEEDSKEDEEERDEDEGDSADEKSRKVRKNHANIQVSLSLSTTLVF